MSPHLASVMCVGVGALWHVFRGPGALTLSARALSTGPNSVLLKQSEVIASPGPHKATVIWMHGLGDSSDGFSGLFRSHLRLPHVRVVLPNAPIQSVTINMGMKMRAWYDIISLDRTAALDFREDEKGIQESCGKIQELLDHECSLVPSDRVILGGFSQGGAMALYSGLSYKERLGGIVSASGYVVLPKQYPKHLAPINLNTKVLTYHGKRDPMVHISYARAGYKVLQDCDVQLDSHEEEWLEHSLSMDEVELIKKFIQTQLEL